MRKPSIRTSDKIGQLILKLNKDARQFTKSREELSKEASRIYSMVEKHHASFVEFVSTSICLIEVYDAYIKGLRLTMRHLNEVIHFTQGWCGFVPYVNESEPKWILPSLLSFQEQVVLLACIETGSFTYEHARRKQCHYSSVTTIRNIIEESSVLHTVMSFNKTHYSLHYDMGHLKGELKRRIEIVKSKEDNKCLLSLKLYQ